MSLLFLKLGGSLITDKSKKQTANKEVIDRIAREIFDVYSKRRNLQLIIGHGSGSFGHSVAERHHTQDGVKTREQWAGFAEVGYVAGLLSNIVLESLIEVGLPVVKIPPSTITRCMDGDIVNIHMASIKSALDAKLIPLVHGDVAFDMEKGGTIVSTEDIFVYLAQELYPERILLAGDYQGVTDSTGKLIPRITKKNFPELQSEIKGSATVDVTGGMESKVSSMLTLCQEIPDISITIFSGKEPGIIIDALATEKEIPGTRITK